MTRLRARARSHAQALDQASLEVAIALAWPPMLPREPMEEGMKREELKGGESVGGGASAAYSFARGVQRMTKMAEW